MDERTANDIEKRIEKILREMGVKEPPLSLEDVMEFLDIYRGYYNLRDPGLIKEIMHRLHVGANKVIDLFEKIKLQGIWFPDEKKILIDEEVHDIKKRWITAHELGHRIVPWHADFIMGDTAETLDPDYHEALEEEANYAASSLLFLASRFSTESADYELNIGSVGALSKIYGNSQAMTLRRFVQFGKDKPMIAVVSRPHWVDNAANELCRYFIPSRKFKDKFSKVTSREIIEEIKRYTIKKIGGPVGGGEFILRDDNGEFHEFIGDSFYNRYDILTLIVHKCVRPIYG